MAVIKCKMCGGDITLSEDQTFGTCNYCGSVMTLPKIDDEQRAARFNRGNHFRRTGDFDKALAVYEQIVQEDDNDAEAHWCCALCRFGIEYVEDPASMEYLPTCHRASFDSFLEDVDYLAAVEHSDGITKRQYQKDAAKIAEVQKGILATSQNEEPFDVFVCYKETDDNTKERTKDSLDAQEIYYKLTEEGYRVFFSRITLEDKVGAEYEPYIFAALNSAKVMVAVGSKPDYFNAVWVKNEWSRFLALMKKDRSKLLLPCYRNMDPYDLPEQLSVLQSYDMAKIGFMQDLIRGIKKVLAKDGPKLVKETVTAKKNTAGTNVAPLLERAFMFLEDGDWEEADTYCEKVLDQDPKNARAYLGKLMAELEVRKQDNLKNCAQPFDGNTNYQKALRFADQTLAETLKGYITSINERNENARLTEIYENAQCTMQNAQSEEAYKKAVEIFKSISGFKDADALAEQCLEKAEVCRRDAIYNTAKAWMVGERAYEYETAINTFRTIPGWRDADAQIEACQKKIEEIKAKEEADRLEAERKAEERRIAAEKAAKKRKKAFAIGTPIVAACIAFVIVLTTVIIPNSKYNAAVSLMNDGKYEEAINAFEALNGYKDSENQIESCYIGKYGEEKWNKIKNIKIGDTYTFGAYEQDNNTSNGKEAIEWTVLDKDGMSLLLVSKQALDCQKYNYTYTDITWEKCSLRTWLNGTFLNNAFSTDEQAKIATTTVSADKNPEYSTNPGNATTDKIFLLSITEAEKYFTTDESRKCAPTAYAKAQGAYTSDSYKTASGEVTCRWWLRSPGDTHGDAADVDTGGSVYCGGFSADIGYDCVRPALWINLDS